MATMKYRQDPAGFAGIRTFAELEASLRVVRRSLRTNQLASPVSQFVAGGGFRWTDVALLLIRALRRRLLRPRTGN